MTRKRWIGIDVGGANLKIADTSGWVAADSFALWKHHQQLADSLAKMLPEDRSNCRFALTMTGELADCYARRDEGVRHIIDATAEACAGAGSLMVYSLDSELLCASEAKATPDDVAAGNWHCLATFAARFLEKEESGLLIDMGSTTTDVIPIDSEGVMTPSRSDLDRLLHSELLYFGAQRTPICAVTTSLPYRDESVPVMAELFATLDDCFLILGLCEEAPDDNDSANGKPRTREQAVERLSRMVGLDSRDFTLEDAEAACRYVESILSTRLEAATTKLGSEATTWILSGHGVDLLPGSKCRKISLAEELGSDISRVGPAYALACLAQERFG